MSKTSKLVPLFALCALACAKQSDDRALVQIDITAPAGVDLKEVTATVAQEGRTLATRTLPWDAGAGGTLKMGVYLEASAKGVVQVSALAVGKDDRHYASNVGAANVESGKRTSPVELTLAPGEGPPQGGAGGHGGGSGGSGAGGAGAGGDGGSTPMMGGAGGGAGGSPPDAGPPADAAPGGPAWGAPANVEKDLVAESFDPSIAIHPTQGHILVAWREPQAIKVARYDGSTGTWAAPKAVEDGATPDSTPISLCFAANGHAMILWRQYPVSGPTKGVWFSRSTDAGVTWSAPALVHDGPARQNLTAGISDSGVVRAAWEESDYVNSDTVVWSGVFDPAMNKWISVAPVAPATNVIDEHATHVAMDGSGAGLLVFIDSVSGTTEQTRVWGVPFNGTGALPGPKMLATNQSGFYRPAVAVAPGGKRAAILAVEDVTTAETLWMYELENGNWNPPGKVTSVYSVGSPVLVIDASGVATAAWTQTLASGNYGVLAARHLPGQSWTAPEPLETTTLAGSPAGDRAPAASLAADGKGRVFAAWNRKTMTTGTFAGVARIFSDGAWQADKVFDVKKDLAYVSLRVAAAPGGMAALAAVLDDPKKVGDPGAYNVFVSIFH